MTVDEAAEIVRDWAAGTDYVVKAWLCGSRVRGTARANSDLDVAIQVLPSDVTPFARIYCNHARWTADLQDRLPWRVHLLHYDETADPSKPVQYGNMKREVDQYGRLVYDRTDPYSL